ncbi:MAG: flavodoxin family protein [Spirochaetaceae bacterium]|nr:flavodoxin family protein [Spirochaetaceae bacterium]
MKVIAINGSPRKDSNTGKALSLMSEELAKDGIETEIITVGNENIHGCVACRACLSSEGNRCAITTDCLNDVAEKARAADGIILGSPTYFAGIAGTMKCFLDRFFYNSRPYLQGKAAASVAITRRAGAVDTVHQLNNYLNLAEMVIAPSQYWVIAYGMEQGEIFQDDEGIQTVRKNARALSWVLRIIAAAKTQIPYPADTEPRIRTNFIR